MARNSGPFKATESSMEQAREYLAFRGIEYKGHSPVQAQRIANKVYQQEQAGLRPNRQAARGHGTTPEHPGRKAPELKPTKLSTEKPVVSNRGKKQGTPAEYKAVKPKPAQPLILPGGRRIYTGNEDYTKEAIKDAAFLGGRVDLVVTFADGSTVTLFTGADHKRNGEHAIDAERLKELLASYDNDLEALIKDLLTRIDETPSGAQSRYKGQNGGELPSGLDPMELMDILEDEWAERGAIVSYTLTFYPYAQQGGIAV